MYGAGLQETMPSRRALLGSIGASSAIGAAGCLGSDVLGGDELEDAREVVSQYGDVDLAIEAGYELSFPYIYNEDGVTGLIFVNHSQSDIEPELPNALLYNLDEAGTYDLLGAKWFASTSSVTEPPSLFGEEFSGPRPGETDDIPEHYGLHAWLFEENPAGMFADTHTGVEPPVYIDDLSTVWDELTRFFSNEELAFEHGYAETDDCISTKDGHYGIPLVNTDLTGTNLETPGVLMYRFGSNWGYNLQGVEWYVRAEDVNDPPTLFGQEFHEPMEGHSPAFEEGTHYGLHAWIFTANPDGVFALFNPRPLC